MAAAKRKINWSKIYFICGDPLKIRQTQAWALQEHKSGSSINLYKDDSVAKIISYIFPNSLFSDDSSVILHNPTSEILKSIWEEISKKDISCSCLVVVAPEFDGRNAFVQAATKNKVLDDLEYIESGNVNALKNHLEQWQADLKISFSKDALKYLLDNAPITVAKIKGFSGKKDAQVYDLEILENELEKIMSLKSSDNCIISIQELQDICVFEQTVDPWAFVRTVLSGSAKEILSTLDNIAATQDAQSVLWLLLSQVEFLIELSSVNNLNTNELERISDELSCKKYLGKYLTPNWETVESTETAPVNIWRIKKAIESSNLWKNKDLDSLYRATSNALQDLRSNLPQEIVFPLFTLAAVGAFKYEDALKPI